MEHLLLCAKDGRGTAKLPPTPRAGRENSPSPEPSSILRYSLVTIRFGLGSPEPDPRHGFECKSFTWKLIPENHGGGAPRRDKAGEASRNVCAEKPAAPAGIRSLIVMGALGASAGQVPGVTPQEAGGRGIGTTTLTRCWLVAAYGEPSCPSCGNEGSGGQRNVGKGMKVPTVRSQ